MRIGVCTFFEIGGAVKRITPRLVLVAGYPKPMLNILVIDGDERTRVANCAALSVAGYAVSSARAGRDALALVREQPMDIVVVDTSVSDAEATHVIQALQQDYPLVGLIAISTKSGTGESPAAEASRIGVQEILRKPFTVSELLAAVRRTEDVVIAPLRSE